jgi:DNA-binding MarR family transcriptional regulator
MTKDAWVPTPRRGADNGASSPADVEAVLRASRALVGIAAESLAIVEDAVTVPQLRVLVMVFTRGPLNLATVATALDVNPSNASRICHRLVKAGLLKRSEAKEDRRNLMLTLTPAGSRLVNKVTQHRRRSIERVLRTMPAGDRHTMAEAFTLFASAAGEPDDDASHRLAWHDPST